MTTATAKRGSPSVVIKEDGAKGVTGDAGVDGVGFNSVRLSALDSPLFQGFQPNKLTTVSAPSGTDSDVTHTRASAATYIDRYGVLKTAGIDELRETADGYQIESVGSTNKALNSVDLNSFAFAVGMTATTDGTLSPDGVNQAVLLSSSQAGSIAFYDIDVSAPDGVAWNRSLIVKRATSPTVTISNSSRAPFSATYNFDTGEITGGVIVGKLKDGWVRFSGTGVTTGSSGVGMEITLEAGLSVYASYVQAEESTFATSNIPTTDAPATRAPDIVSMPYENNVPRGDQPYTIIFKGIIDGYTNFNRLFGTETNDTAKSIFSYVNSSGNISHTNGSDANIISTGDQITFGEIFTYIVTSDGINYTSYLNGVLQASSVVTNPATELPNEMRILQGYNSAIDSNGKCSLFKTLPYAVTADEVKLIS